MAPDAEAGGDTAVDKISYIHMVDGLQLRMQIMRCMRMQIYHIKPPPKLITLITLRRLLGDFVNVNHHAVLQ